MDGFIIIGNTNAVTYKEVFPLIKSGKVRFGYNGSNKDMYFNLPEEYREIITKEKREGSGWKNVNGVVCGRLANACWFTNLPVSKKPLILTKTYTPEDYPKYDNYDAINVDRVKDIPCDYEGIMGVPVTILNYDLNNIEIVKFRKGEDEKDLSVDGKDKYFRVLIKKNFEIVGIANNVRYGDYPCLMIINGKHLYSRVLIRRKKDD